MNYDKLVTDTAIAQFGFEMPKQNSSNKKSDNSYNDDESGWVKREFRKICGGTRPLDGRVRCMQAHPFNSGKRNDCLAGYKKRQDSYDACVESVRQQNIAGLKAENLPVDEYVEEPVSSGMSGSTGGTRTSTTEQPKSNTVIYVVVAVVLLLAIVGFVVWKRRQAK